MSEKFPTLGREQYYIGVEDIQFSNVEHLEKIAKHLENSHSFLMCGRSFDLLSQLGYVETCQFEAKSEITSRSITQTFDALVRQHYHEPRYDRIFVKNDGHIITELYLRKADFVFKEDRNDNFYQLMIKGSYYVKDLSFVRSTKPSIVEFDDRGEIILSCVTSKVRKIWYYNILNCDTYKTYESSLKFDIDSIIYNNKRSISSIDFKIGHNIVDHHQICAIFPELKDLRLSQLVNWEHHISTDEINVLAMMYC